MQKFAIWGLGGRGMAMIALLGIERIAAIIEKDIQLQGTTYQGKSIISPQIYLDKYRDYPIIVTPQGYESSIIDWLNNKGIFWAFSFEEEFSSIESILKQVSMDELISEYQHGEVINIWGYTALGILLYEFLCERGYECKMLFEESLQECKKLYMEKVLGMVIESIGECISELHRILLTQKMDERYEKVFKENKIEKFYNLGLERERFYNSELEKFKNIHQGEKCFIVATGPSLRIADLDKLYKNKQISISMNGIFPAFQETDWRPDYYILSDLCVCMRWSEDIARFRCNATFIADAAWMFGNVQEKQNIYKWHLIKEWKGMPNFSDDFARGGFAGNTVTYEGLQLMVYMGFSEIYLLGVDCNYQKGSHHNHFTPENEPDRNTHNVDRMQLAFLSAKKFADTHGIKIYNATRGGKLEVFERVDFDSLF